MKSPAHLPSAPADTSVLGHGSGFTPMAATAGFEVGSGDSDCEAEDLPETAEALVWPPDELEVAHRSFAGHGLALVEGRPVFVPGAIAGERVLHRGVRSVRGRLWAQVEQVLVASPQRGPTDCAHSDTCPGCPLRHLRPEAALAAKVEAHRDTFLRFGAVPADEPRIWAGPDRDGHRHRLVARALPDAEGALVLGLGRLPGFQEPLGLVPLSTCPAQEAHTAHLLQQVQDDLNRLGVVAARYGAMAGLRHVAIQHHDAGASVVLGFGTGGAATPSPAEAPSDEVLRAEVLREHPAVSLYVERFGRRHNPVGSALQHLRGPEHTWIQVDGHRLRATPPAWTPQTPGSVAAVRAAVLELLEPQTTDRVIEVGCGIGTLSLSLARHVAQLTGIDACRESVADATVNAQIAGLANAVFRAGRAEHAMRRLVSKGARVELVVLHAMRLPYGPVVLDAVRLMRPRRVLLIGPSAAAVATDTRDLTGFSPKAWGFVDQMPGTSALLNLVALGPN